MRWLARMAIVLLLVWFGWLCVALAVDTDAKTPKTYWRVTLNGRYLNGDSADVLVAYPADEDTAGKRISCTWIGGTYNVWQFAPDSTDVYDFYGRASTGADTLIAYMTDRWVQGVTSSEGYISSSRAFAAGVVDSAALAVDAAAKSLLATGSGAIDLTGTTLGTSPLPATFDSVNVETHLIVGDSVFIGGNLITQSDIIQLGNVSTDQVTIKGDLITEDDIKFGLALSDTMGFIGPATFHDSVHVGSQGDTTTTHRISTGFFRYVQGIVELTYSAATTSETHDFPGATSDMVFLAWDPTSAATADQFAATYLSAGKITVVAQASSGGTRDIIVMGFKK